MKLKDHPAAEIFPLMEGADFDALVQDIRAHGQRELIVVHENSILDGRNRYRACCQLGIQPKTENWNRAGTPEAFVISMNLHRRHLNETQRAMIAGRIAKRGVGAAHRNVGIPTLNQAAEMLQINRDTITDARLVLLKGEPEEIAACDAGEAAVSSVAREIRRKASPKERALRIKGPLAARGNNPERLQNMKLEAEVWGRLQAALDGLTNLPRPADVVAIVSNNFRRTEFTKSRLSQATKWLEEFSDEWKRRRDAAA